MEFVLIITLSDKMAEDLNHRKINGLSVFGHHNFRELNNSSPTLHGKIKSRVFYAQDASPDEKYRVILGDPNAPEKEQLFTVPKDKEYLIINFD